MDHRGLRLTPGRGFRLDWGFSLYIKAYRVPHRAAFNVPIPWWSFAVIDNTRRITHNHTVFEGQELHLDLKPGTYTIEQEYTVLHKNARLNIQYFLVTRNTKEEHPLRRTRIDENESDVFLNATTPGTGRSLNLVNVRRSYLVFEPVEVVHGDGYGTFYLEHSSDNKEWERVYHGGFPDGGFKIDQNNLCGPQCEPMVLAGGVKQYVRWSYEPSWVCAWGFRGGLKYYTESRHG